MYSAFKSCLAGFAFLAVESAAFAQSPMPGGMPPPPGMSLARSAAMRFPQPVLVGTLLHRDVLRPIESQDLLGRVDRVVRDPQGTIDVVIAFGGLFGIGARPIAVPIDAMVLLGQDMEIVAYTPAQLRDFPVFRPAGYVTLPADQIIRVGLAKPSH